MTIERQTHYLVARAPPEYGLYSLLDIWPVVRQRVPDAILLAIADFSSWRKEQDPINRYMVLQLEERLRTTPGVKHLSRDGLSAALSISGALVYMTSELEGLDDSDIRAAMRLGCRVVCASAFGNFNRHAVTVPGDILAQNTRTGYVNAICHVLQATEGDSRVSRALDRKKLELYSG
jgi:hypothetical protein